MYTTTNCLQSVKLDSGETLYKDLSASNNPQQTIDSFQKKNSIQLDSLQPALPLLDLHAVPRLQFHEYVMKSLRGTLLKRGARSLYFY